MEVCVFNNHRANAWVPLLAGLLASSLLSSPATACFICNGLGYLSNMDDNARSGCQQSIL